MIIDNIINNLDSSTYHTAEFHDPDLEIFFDGGFLLVTPVSEVEFCKLRREPNDETIRELVDLHGGHIRRDH